VSGIWLPTSSGMVNIRVWRLNQAAAEYDPRLMVGRNEIHGDWVVYMKMGPLSPPHPVLHLGFDESELPEPEDLKRKLYRMDTVRHGEKILDDMIRHNDRLEAEQRRAADEATELAAEALAWGANKMTNYVEGKQVSVKLNEKAHRRARMTT